MARPLIVRFGAVGDLVMTTPLLRHLAQRHGQPCAVLGAGGWLPTLFRHLPFVGEVRTLRSRHWPPWVFSSAKRAVTAWIRDQGFGPVYLLQDDPISRGIVERARPAEIIHNGDLPQDPTEHTCRRHLRLARASDAPSGVELRVAIEEAAEVETWLARRRLDGPAPICIQPGNRKTSRFRIRASDHKIWPEERWIETIRGLAEREPERPILILGSPKEAPLAERLAHGTGLDRVHSVADDLPLRRLLALLAHSRALVSVDTGPAHIAAAVGCPVLALFGRTDPRTTGPWRPGGPVACVRPPAARDLGADQPWPTGLTLDQIPVTDVLATWDRFAADVLASAHDEGSPSGRHRTVRA